MQGKDQVTGTLKKEYRFKMSEYECTSIYMCVYVCMYVCMYVCIYNTHIYVGVNHDLK
jgi:hypothetical protein